MNNGLLRKIVRYLRVQHRDCRNVGDNVIESCACISITLVVEFMDHSKLSDLEVSRYHWMWGFVGSSNLILISLLNIKLRKMKTVL